MHLFFRICSPLHHFGLFLLLQIMIYGNVSSSTQNICYSSIFGIKTTPYPRVTELLVQHLRRRKEMRDIGGRSLTKAPLKLSFVVCLFFYMTALIFSFFSRQFFFVLVCICQDLFVPFLFLSLLLHQSCILHL